MYRAMQAMLGCDMNVAGRLSACDVLVQSSICSTRECVLEQALQGERVSKYGAMVRRRDGRQIPVRIYTDFLLDKKGNLVGLIEVIKDISLVCELCELNAKMQEVSDLKHRLGSSLQWIKWLPDVHVCKK